MKQLKEWNKLFIKIGLLSITMMLLSLITDTEIYNKWFTYEVDGSLIEHVSYEGEVYYGCDHPHCHNRNITIHKHWNYRGFIYVFTGAIYFFLSIARIIFSTKGKELV